MLFFVSALVCEQNRQVGKAIKKGKQNWVGSSLTHGLDSFRVSACGRKYKRTGPDEMSIQGRGWINLWKRRELWQWCHLEGKMGRDHTDFLLFCFPVGEGQALRYCSALCVLQQVHLVEPFVPCPWNVSHGPWLVSRPTGVKRVTCTCRFLFQAHNHKHYWFASSLKEAL